MGPAMIATPPAFTALVEPRDHPATLTFAFRGDEMLAPDGGFALPDDAACRANGIDPGDTVPVGLLGDAYCRAVAFPPGASPAPGFALRPLRSFFGTVDDGLLAVAARAKQVAEWARTHRFCGACGSATRRLAGERAMKCPAWSTRPRWAGSWGSTSGSATGCISNPASTLCAPPPRPG